MVIDLEFFRSVKIQVVLLFAGILFVLQLLTGTNLDYAILVFIFTLFTATAVNAAGGLVTVGGFGIAMIGLKVVIISQWAKVLFGQPSNSHLEVPVLTMAVLTTGMLSILMSSITIKPFLGGKKIFKPIDNSEMLLGISVFTYVIGFAAYLYTMTQGYSDAAGEIKIGGVVGIARQLVFIYPLSIICSIAYTIVSSNYKKSLNIWVLITIVTQLFVGILGTSKQVLFEPFMFYFLVCMAFGYKFKPKHMILGIMIILIMVVVLFPFAQVGRVMTRDGNPKQNIELTKLFIKEIFTKSENLEEIEWFLEEAALKKHDFYYYGSNKGLLDRFSLIQENDELINATITKGHTGWPTITHGFKMLLPRFIYPDKPIYNTANYLGHKIDIIGEDDNTTQISMGIIAEAYDAFGWTGVVLIPYLIMAAFLMIYNILSGPVERNIWTIFLMGIFQHNLVEATVSSMIQYILYFPLLLLTIYMVLMIFVPALRSSWEKLNKWGLTTSESQCILR